jgi:hypothetical protein
VIGLDFEGPPEGHKYGHRTGIRLRYLGPTASPTAIVGAILPFDGSEFLLKVTLLPSLVISLAKDQCKLGPSFPQVRAFLGVVPRLAYEK